jgi:CMP-N,N'-diacetyllegionaminic acid synthase
MKIVTLIPARGGSKGIPRKNLTILEGKPLISYTIEASLKSLSQQTWVSSEDKEILTTASLLGAKTLERPQSLASDNATSESVLLHFAENVDFDILVFIQATSPLIVSDDINRGLQLLRDYDSVVSVIENSQLLWADNGPLYDLNSRQRRQDANKMYLETGGIFITTRNGLNESRCRLSGNIGLLELPKIRGFDIDSFDDLELVKIIMKGVKL